MPANTRPGIHVRRAAVSPTIPFRTGVAGFLAPARAGGTVAPASGVCLASDALASWLDFGTFLRGDGRDRVDVLVYHAVRGFFLNGGERCYVVLYDARATGDPGAALDTAAAALAERDEVDLVCAPSLMWESEPRLLQQRLLARCAELRDDWFVILDSPAEGTADLASWVAELRAACTGDDGGGVDATMYCPWVRPFTPDVELPPPDTPPERADPFNPIPLVPPSGHLAGVLARTDRAVGVHKPPANERIEAAVDVAPGGAELPAGVNELRTLPGRGIRAWGARTLAPRDGSDQIGVRRLILTLRRWLLVAMDWVAFEPNDFRLWVRVNRELNARLTEMFRRGAFEGRTPSEAFYVKCDGENNPDELRAAGELRIDIGVAPAVPKEFITIQLLRREGSLTFT